MAHGGVVGFYDSHPLNEEQILQSLARRGKGPHGITPEDLFEFDQDHYGGVEAVAVLAERASISKSSVVLDLCSGLGGPARYLAWRYGCRVVGIDITASRVDGAKRLTEIAGLSDQVRFVHADATELPFAAESFTALISQEAFVHISDKTRLLSRVPACASAPRSACLHGLGLQLRGSPRESASDLGVRSPPMALLPVTSTVVHSNERVSPT